MTIEVNDTKEQYTISGVGPYAFSFRIFSETDLAVTALQSGQVDPVTLTVNSHFTVAGVNSETGGSITLINSAQTTYANYTLDIRSDTPVNQPTSIKNQGTYAPSVHEIAFDRLSRQVQDVVRQLKQSWRYPDNVNLDAVMTSRNAWLGKYPFVNTSGVIEPALLSSTTMTQSTIGALLYPQTPAELAASVTPVNLSAPPRPWYDAKRDCVLDGTTDDYTQFNNILLIASTNNMGVIIDGPMLIGTNITVPANVQLWFVGLGKLKPAANKTVTINGTVIAGNNQIFDLSNSGSVVTGAMASNFNASWYGIAPATSAASNASYLQKLITAFRPYSAVVQLPSGQCSYDTSLTIDLTTYVEYPFILKGYGYNNGDPTVSGSTLAFTGTATDALVFNRGGNNQNSIVTISDFNLIGDGTQTTGANGISGSVNLTRFKRLRVGSHRGYGYSLASSYASEINGGLIINNFSSGIFYNGSSNRVRIQDISIFGNGRDFTTPNQGNIFFGGAAANYAPVIDNVDVSYSGNQKFTISGGTLTSIVVAGGTATVNTVSAHGLSSTNVVAINGCTTTSLNSVYSSAITSTGANTFTFATGAPNGTYNNAGLMVGTYSCGILMVNTTGAVIRNLYCENPCGPAAYIAAGCSSITFDGGFVLNGALHIDQATNVEISGIRFQGASAVLRTSELNNRATINVRLASLDFNSGATWVKGTYYMQDGIRYGNAAPGTGTWLVGEIIYNSAPSVGNPKGWVCTVAGTPGTFVSIGNL